MFQHPRPRFFHRLSFAGAAALAFCLPPGAVTPAQAADHFAATPEYVLKAGFLYNFAQFTTWPNRPDKLLHLCVLGPDPFGASLDSIDGKDIAGNRLVIHRTRSTDTALRTCQIIFVADPEVDGFVAHVGADASRDGQLTVAERDGAARAGIMIGLTLEERRLGFEFNQQVAERHGVTISSKLLRLARKVY